MRSYAIAAAVMATAGFLPAGPANADVRAGVDAWNRQDYAAAVREWEQPAAAGNADALYNLAEAYASGRGVPADPARAEQLYARAAAKGHVPAADAYGLMLARDGRMAQALPYIEDAAARGDPRAEYVLGVSYFNGDGVERDPARAYALMAASRDAGLPQAVAAAAEMERSIPPEQRRQAANMAPAAAPWRVQLGSFSVPGNADRLWRRLRARDALAGRRKIVETQGRLSILFAGGYASRAEAGRACRSLKATGQDCLVTRD